MTSTTRPTTNRQPAIIVGTTFVMLCLLVGFLAIANTWPAIPVGIIGAVLLLIGVVLLAVADADPIKKLLEMWPGYQDWCRMLGHAGNISAAVLAIVALCLIP